MNAGVWRKLVRGQRAITRQGSWRSAATRRREGGADAISALTRWFALEDKLNGISQPIIPKPNQRVAGVEDLHPHVVCAPVWWPEVRWARIAGWS